MTTETDKTALLDAEHLTDLFAEGDRDLFEALLEGAQEDAAVHLAALSPGIDATAAEAAFHGLKGMAGSLGMLRLQTLASGAMARAEGGQTPDEATMSAVAQCWIESLEAFRHYGAQLS